MTHFAQAVSEARLPWTELEVVHDEENPEIGCSQAYPLALGRSLATRADAAEGWVDRLVEGVANGRTTGGGTRTAS